MNKKLIHPIAFVPAVSEVVSIRARAYVRTRKGTHLSRYPKGLLRTSLVAVAVFATLVCTSGQALAETQGYQTQETGLQNGMVVAAKNVSVSDGNTVTYVEKSSASRADKTIGIVVDQRSGSVTTSEPGSTVYVATSGSAIAYVSDVNGKVRKGDLVVASPIEGVLMRSTIGTSGVVGIAMQDFPEDSTETVKLQTNNGHDIEVKIATVQINMDTKTTKNSADVSKSILQRIGEALVRREVTSTQAFIATIIFVLLLIVVGGIIYAAVSSTIISLGRNPFARKTILRSLMQVTILVAVVLAVGLGAIYWVLWI